MKKTKIGNSKFANPISKSLKFKFSKFKNPKFSKSKIKTPEI